jgi:hypothetical protein
MGAAGVRVVDIVVLARIAQSGGRGTVLTCDATFRHGDYRVKVQQERLRSGAIESSHHGVSYIA